jgi:hypothetical protein
MDLRTRARTRGQSAAEMTGKCRVDRNFSAFEVFLRPPSWVGLGIRKDQMAPTAVLPNQSRVVFRPSDSRRMPVQPAGVNAQGCCNRRVPVKARSPFEVEAS